ncbi:MAG TPA: SprT family zinc-dependent metalloprotease [Candidatus Competibacteraceae bacterium]|nr:SprT family zinc-dependent metalloprotease [Candidatus Competibacteraceae bacterium]
MINTLVWARRHQTRPAMQYRQSPPEMVSGESHYFLGQRHQLRVMAYTGPPRIRRSGSDFIDLFVRSGTTVEQRQQVLQGWYRAQLRARIPPLLEQWQPVLGVQAADWGIKQMKTRWGTCNIAARRIWLNLELIKKPVNCLEYVVIHELTHLLERNHNDRFKALMDHHLPHWRLIRQTLNHAP